MTRMAEIKTWDGDIYRLTEAQGEIITEAMSSGKTSAVLPGKQGVLIFANIKSFDYVKVQEEPAVMDRPLLPPSVNLEDIKPNSEYQERWKRLIKLNLERMKKKQTPYERVPLLKNLDDLDDWEQNGVWPEYVPLNEWRTTPSKPEGMPAQWVKKRVTRKEWDRTYAHSSHYHKLTEDGSDMWVAWVRAMDGKPMPDDVITCEPSEIDRLEMLLSTR